MAPDQQLPQQATYSSHHSAEIIPNILHQKKSRLTM